MQWSNLSFLALVLGFATASACSENVPVELASPTTAAGLDVRPTNATCLAPPLPAGRVALKPFYSGLYRPLAMVDRPEHGVIFIAEMPGRVKVIDRETGAITTALDLVGKVGSYFEQGLLGIAVHPTKPYVYLTVERDADATTLKDLPYRAEIIRLAINPDWKTFDPASETLVLRIDRPTTDHYPGTLEFGKDGFLYIGVGDGGRNYFPNVLRYDPNQLLGSILRIDVDVDGDEPYAVPPDNPFVSGGGRPEIWAGGFRNPWRFTFDRQTGDLWTGDVGDGAYEEIDKVERGKDYGWPTLEANICFKPHVGCDPTGLAPPVFAYPHAEGGSITGGYVYRGKLMPDLVGKYIYADFVVGRIFALEAEASGELEASYLNPGGPKPSVSSFGQDSEGEIYALDWDSGVIYQLTAGIVDKTPVFPTLLSQTGCVNPADATQVASGLVPYGVNVNLWSDGASKARYVAIPDGTTIHVEDSGDFTLPERSVVLKEFTVAGKRIETRLLYQHPGGDWSGATYEWNDAQTDATLLDEGREKLLPNGQTWSFPSSAQCFVCHKKGVGRTIGLEALQLNGDFAYAPGRSANQLTKLADIGYLDKRLDPATTPALPALDGPAPIEDRARGYLHTNCSMCHRVDAGTGAGMDLRFGLPRSAMSGCTPATFAGATTGATILAPGDPGHSAIYLRMTTRDNDQMPPLATHLVDDVGSSVVGDWIRGLETCGD